MLGLIQDPNAKTKDGLTPLMHAAYGGNASAAEMLIRAGADPAFKDIHGRTAEDEACGSGEKGHAKVCVLLHEALAKK
jgi:ankyrin repeat protein